MERLLSWGIEQMIWRGGVLQVGKAWEVVSEGRGDIGAESYRCPMFPIAMKPLCRRRCLVSGDTGVGNGARNSLKYLPRPVL